MIGSTNTKSHHLLLEAPGFQGKHTKNQSCASLDQDLFRLWGNCYTPRLSLPMSWGTLLHELEAYQYPIIQITGDPFIKDMASNGKWQISSYFKLVVVANIDLLWSGRLQCFEQVPHLHIDKVPSANLSTATVRWCKKHPDLVPQQLRGSLFAHQSCWS